MAECLAAVEQMMRSTNKPHNVQSAINNTGSKFGKAAVQRALDELTAKKKLVYMEVGKTGKLYLWNQSLIPVLSQEQLADLRTECEALQARVESLGGSVAAEEQEAAALAGQPTLSELQEQVRELEARSQAQKERIRGITEGGRVVSDAEMAQINKAYATAMMAWAARRQKCMETLDGLCEAMEKKPAAVRSLLGLEEGLPQAEFVALKEKYPYSKAMLVKQKR